MNAVNKCQQQNWPRIHFDIMSVAIETNNEAEALNSLL